MPATASVLPDFAKGSAASGIYGTCRIVEDELRNEPSKLAADPGTAVFSVRRDDPTGSGESVQRLDRAAAAIL
jgi:hypothetical protein